MPIIQEENDSFRTDMEQKLNYNKVKMKDIGHNNAVSAKNVTVNILKPATSPDALHKIEQNEYARISKMTKSRVKMIEETMFSMNGIKI